jgi:hypothetical protein
MRNVIALHVLIFGCMYIDVIVGTLCYRLINLCGEKKNRRQIDCTISPDRIITQ